MNRRFALAFERVDDGSSARVVCARVSASALPCTNVGALSVHAACSFGICLLEFARGTLLLGDFNVCVSMVERRDRTCRERTAIASHGQWVRNVVCKRGLSVADGCRVGIARMTTVLIANRLKMD